jgi:hypothetical protein
MDMIQANELRIGNLIELPAFTEPENMTEKICADFGYSPVYATYAMIRDAEHYGDNWLGRPIPLTEDKLVELGFVENKSDKINPAFHGFYLFINGSIELCWQHGYFCMYIEGQAIELYNVKAVHHVQNLHFALTGQELTVNNQNK